MSTVIITVLIDVPYYPSKITTTFQFPVDHL